uniref:Uncharacterized protein n=1 Tax=Picea glauca TaxID=3330 RepID=A0A101M268_PICGL|nr:hypothetical protein ABT39_MTgene2829 [Picea glauca]QHR87638.1 hypothetical protein Q903MT_gene1650 [Picea sitchensis]
MTGYYAGLPYPYLLAMSGERATVGKSLRVRDKSKRLFHSTNHNYLFWSIYMEGNSYVPRTGLYSILSLLKELGPMQLSYLLPKGLYQSGISSTGFSHFK